MNWPSIWHDLQPALIAFATAAAALLVLSLCAGPRRPSLAAISARLRRLPGCERGGVQGLSFVITLPLYVMLVLFIIQVGLLMQAVVVVHYAAFATARAASVWLPAAVQAPGYPFERHNVIAAPLTATMPAVVALDSVAGTSVLPSETSLKLVKLAQAAVMGCAAIAPSSEYGFAAGPESGRLGNAVVALYTGLTPDILDNPRQVDRLQRKIAYAAANTYVRVQWTDHDSLRGPTYDPQDIVLVPSVVDLWRMQNRGPGLNLRRRALHEGEVPPGASFRAFVPNEIGWEDTITVRVTHMFALLPGPGRFLARQIAGNAASDPVRERIAAGTAPNGRPLYTVPLSASAQITCEGLKPVLDVPQQ